MTEILVEKEPVNVKVLLFQLLLGLIASAGALSTGMSLGFSAIALPQLEKNGSNVDYLNPEESSWFASIPSIATPIGCLICGPLLDRFGRRITLLVLTPTFLTGWLLLALSPKPSPIIILYLGRLFTGFATGMASIPGVVYLAEISQQSLRGVLVTWPSVAISLGILLVYILGAILTENWRLVAGISATFPVLAAVSTFFLVPESPTWLLSKQRVQEAEISFKKIRSIERKSELTGTAKEEFENMKMAITGFKEKFRISFKENVASNSDFKDLEESSIVPDIVYNNLHEENTSKSPNANIKSYLTTIDDSREFNEENHENFSSMSKIDAQNSSTKSVLEKAKETFFLLLRPEVWKPLLILNGYFFFQQFSGIYVVVFYAVDIVKEAGVKIDAYLATVLLGVVQLVAGMATSFAMTRFGRRPMSLWSGIGMTVCMIALAIYLQILASTSTDDNVPASVSWIPLMLMLLYVIAGAIGFHTLPWAMVGELYPAKVKGVAGGITTCMAYLFNFAALKMYPALVVALGGSNEKSSGSNEKSSEGVFYFYGVISFIATLFVIFFLTETHGKTLQEIENEYLRPCNVKCIPFRRKSVSHVRKPSRIIHV